MDFEELEAIYQLLSKLDELDERNILTIVNYVIGLFRRTSFLPQQWFNLLLFILECEPKAIARRNVVRIIHNVLQEHKFLCRGLHLLFRDFVRKEIAAISHATDTGTSGKVRIFLHQCIFEWIEAGIVSAQFLKHLQRQEETWTFQSERPRYHPTPEGSPSIFDLVLLGIQGRQQSLDGRVNMRDLVQQGMVQGVRDGWMGVDEHGHHVVTVRVEVSTL